jgi:hypothetical protein
MAKGISGTSYAFMSFTGRHARAMDKALCDISTMKLGKRFTTTTIFCVT